MTLIALPWITACRTEAPSSPVPVAAEVSPEQELVISVQRQDWAGAEGIVARQLALDPTSRPWLIAAADLAFAQAEWDSARRKYEAAIEVSDDAVPPVVLHRGAESAAKSHHYGVAIEWLKQYVERAPEDANSRTELVGLLIVLGREWEAVEHLRWLVDHGKAGIPELMVLIDRSRPQAVRDEIEAVLAASPEDPKTRVGLARLALFNAEWDEAANQCRAVLNETPDFLPAWILLGRALWELGDAPAFHQWLARPPAGAEQHPDYWLTIAVASADLGDHSGAVRAYCESLALDPTLRESLRSLPPLLLELEQSDAANRVSEIARRSELAVELADAFATTGRQSQTIALRIAETLGQLDRITEAERWAYHALRLKGEPDPRGAALHRQIVGQLVGKRRPANGFWKELIASAELKGPALLERDGSTSQQLPLPSDTSTDPTSTYQLVDESQSRGVEFTYINGDDHAVPGMHLHQANGGGVAVLDFDLNGFPDLYFVQGGPSPNPLMSKQPAYPPSHFYRNDGVGFKEVAMPSRTDVRGYGQGVATGDYDNDGFTDLVVGSIGQTRLLRNQGDGTFREVADVFEQKRSHWTTSLALADVNDDGHPDLFEVNYCKLDEVLTSPCLSTDGKEIPVSCSPTTFAPEPDRLWISDGVGGFDEVSSDALRTDAPGRGLGLVIAEMDGRPGVEIYVANDMTANHLWVRRPGEEFAFDEQAGLRGVATDDRGKPQASMGIAAGDPDMDGDFDLFVTNFEGESNNFFRQSGEGRFRDQARAVGVAAPSFLPLGFGTQFIDLDRDERMELFVANGHISDYQSDHGPFAMRPQLFECGSDRWREVPAASLGEYFSSEHLGRAVALVDVQRDGATDLVVTDLWNHSALLINHTPQQAPCYSFELRGTRASRDAVGAKLTLIQGDRRSTRWVTAGDGFHCSSEKCYSFASFEPGALLEIVWPDGHIQQVPCPSPDHYLVIEE